jgi:uncharacterized protein YdhG (YjbR/CyaY superfamily)
MENKKAANTIDEYIAHYPRNIQNILEGLRQVIRETTPDAKEVISYQMPAFKQNGILVWFAAFKSHIGFFPKASAIEAFKNKLTPYQISKGTVRFPLNEPLPLDLIKEIVKFRVEEDLTRNKESHLFAKKLIKEK